MKIIFFILFHIPLLLFSQNYNWGVFVGANYWLEQNNINTVRGQAPYQINNSTNWHLGANYQWTLRNPRRHIIGELGMGKHKLFINSSFKATDYGHSSTAIINVTTSTNRIFTSLSLRFAYDWHLNKNLSLATFVGAGLLYFTNESIYSNKYTYLSTDTTITPLYRNFRQLSGYQNRYSRSLPVQPYAIWGINVSYNLSEIKKQLILGLSFETSHTNYSKDFISHTFYDNNGNTAGYFSYRNALKKLSIRCEFKF